MARLKRVYVARYQLESIGAGTNESNSIKQVIITGIQCHGSRLHNVLVLLQWIIMTMRYLYNGMTLLENKITTEKKIVHKVLQDQN